MLLALTCCTQSHLVRQVEPQPSAAGAAATVMTGALCTRLTALQCEAEARCCSAPGRSRDACESARISGCENDVHLDAIAANPVAGFDAAAADEVFAELSRRLSSCDPEVVRWSGSQTGLRTLFKGSVAAGQSCKPAQLVNAQEADQAAALLSCKDAEHTACMPKSLLGEWTCSAKSTQGGSCLTADNCDADSYCTASAQAVFGTCAPRLSNGESCSDAAQCQSFSCGAGTCQAPDVQRAFCPDSAS
jgi:hypothetical protein